VVKEANDAVGPLANAHTLIKQVINLVMILINGVHVVSNSAHLTWDCLTVDAENRTLPRGEEVNRTWLLGIMGMVYLDVCHVLAVALLDQPAVRSRMKSGLPCWSSLQGEQH
jgi:hypothetical protein